MAEKRLFWHRATRALICAGGVALFILLSCGEALGPVSNSWRKVAEFEGAIGWKIEGLTVTPGGVYAALWRPGTPTKLRGYTSELAIVTYRGGRLEDDWVLRDAGEGSCMYGLDIIGSVVWAGGTRSEKGKPINYFPLLVRNIGSGWHEVDLGPSPGFRGIGRVYPVSEDVCWVLTGDRDPGRWYGSLVLYENGALRKFPTFRYVTAAYDAGAHTLYVIRRTKGPVIEVAITRDMGASWTYESAMLKPFPGVDLTKKVILPPQIYRSDLYFVVEPGEKGAGTSIYRRTGAPGAGEYELVFFTNLGPYFRSVDYLAADDTRLMGTGVDTCLIYDRERWLMERLPYEHTSFNGLGAAPTGFYATADNETSGKLELLFHP